MHEDAADVFEFALVTCVMTCAITKQKRSELAV